MSWPHLLSFLNISKVWARTRKANNDIKFSAPDVCPELNEISSSIKNKLNRLGICQIKTYLIKNILVKEGTLRLTESTTLIFINLFPIDWPVLINKYPWIETTIKKDTKAKKKLELIEKIESITGIKKLTVNENNASITNA